MVTDRYPRDGVRYQLQVGPCPNSAMYVVMEFLKRLFINYGY